MQVSDAAYHKSHLPELPSLPFSSINIICTVHMQVATELVVGFPESFINKEMLARQKLLWGDWLNGFLALPINLPGFGMLQHTMHMFMYVYTRAACVKANHVRPAYSHKHGVHTYGIVTLVSWSSTLSLLTHLLELGRPHHPATTTNAEKLLQ